MSSFRTGALFMLTEKLLKMFSQLLIMILLARHLGAEQIGSLMLCYALASIFLFLNQLGLENILAKQFALRPRLKSSLLTNALFLRIGASFVCCLLVNLLGLFLVPNALWPLLLIISLYHVFLPAEILGWFFRSQGNSVDEAWGLMAATVVGFCVRLLLILLHAELIWFGLAYVMESLAMAICFGVLFKRTQGVKLQVWSGKQARILLQESLPLLLAGAVILLYMKTDQIMLGMLSGESEVGFYVSATRLSEAWYFVGLTILNVYFAKFLSDKERLGDKAYQQGLLKIGRLITWASLLLGVLVMAIANWLITWLYGESFSPSALILTISIWAIPFVYLGAIATKMYVAEGQQNIVLWRSLAGLVVNILLNYLLIPTYGGAGAAIATVFSQFMSGFLFNFLAVRWMVIRMQLSILTPFSFLPRD